MTHAIVTRMLYPDRERLDERMEIYLKHCLPRLRIQTKQGFDIVVLCNRKHRKVFEKLGIIPIFMKDNWFGQRPTKYWSAFTSYDNLEGYIKYDIQTSIDSDDMLSRDYVETVEDIIKKESEGKSLHIHFKPRFYKLSTGEEKYQDRDYGINRGTAFYSIYQPDKRNYVYVGSDSHLWMPKKFNKSIFMPEGYCWIGIHDNNDSTTMK